MPLYRITSELPFSPGNFLVRNEALVIIDLDIVTVVVAGDKATLIPIGPSHGCPEKKIYGIPFVEETIEDFYYYMNNR